MTIRILMTAALICAPHVALATQIQDVRGNVFVVRDGVNLLAENGMMLNPGDAVSAGSGATAVISYDNECKIPLGRDLIVSIADRSPCAPERQPETVQQRAGDQLADPHATTAPSEPESTGPSPVNMTTMLLGAAAIGGVAAVVIGSSGGSSSSSDKPASP